MTTALTNDIPTMQLRPELLALMRARRRVYSRAKLVHGLFVLVSVALPVLSVILSASPPDVKAYFALTALILLLLDIGVIEGAQKDRLKKGARLQEEFDVTVMDMPWNRFVAGAKVDPEDVRAASAKPLSKKAEAELIGWYEPCVGDVSPSFGRLICQRTNITYDSRIRRMYGSVLLYIAILLGIGLLFTGLIFKLNFSDMVLTVLVPVTPVLGWALREHRKQMDAANALVNLKSEFEKLWDKALNGSDPSELRQGSRQLQDALYQHRASSPLVFDWVYGLLRSANEDTARHAAQSLVVQAKHATNKEICA